MEFLGSHILSTVFDLCHGPGRGERLSGPVYLGATRSGDCAVEVADEAEGWSVCHFLDRSLVRMTRSDWRWL